MKQSKKILLVTIIVVSLICFQGCVSKEASTSSSPFGMEIYRFCVENRAEFCVIKVKQILEQHGADDPSIKQGFIEAGGVEENWVRYSQAARDVEFDSGVTYAEKLKVEKIMDADIVEYVKATLKNASKTKKLAFSAGFVSAFEGREQRKRALDHFYTLWLWAMPSE